MKDHCPINVDTMKPVDSIEGEDAADTKLLRQMATEAHDFICSQEWCERIDHEYLAYGIGGVVAVFLVLITPRSENIDKCLWVIVGDLPPAYIVVEDNLTAPDALDAYCSEMESWVEAAKKGDSTEDLIPVNVPATPESARELEGRLEFLRQKVLPLVSIQK
jgi:hypothetical protein